MLNNDSLNISVIIPVYNASKFIEDAVKSALAQKEVDEIILIEDGSKDNSYLICKQLESVHENVVLYTHCERANKGAGASRNLGIKKARSKYIAFLDADDVFLINRFETDFDIFKNEPSADGVYNCIGSHFYSDNIKNNYNKVFKSEFTTLSDRVPPDEVLKVLLGIHASSNGHFSLIGLTIKKALIGKVGYQNEKLRLHQDTEWFLRLALYSNLYPGKLHEAVALRGVHDQNRFINNEEKFYSRFLMYYEIVKSSHISSYPANYQLLFIRRLLGFYKKRKKIRGAFKVVHALIIILYNNLVAVLKNKFRLKTE